MKNKEETYMTNQEKHLNYLKKEKNLNPVIASLRIILIYMIIGFLWIFLSDELLIIAVDDPIVFQRLQLYKGWFYVVASAAIFYMIIFNQMKKYVEKIDVLDLAYIELEKAHQELLSFERQLHQTAYYDELTQLPNKAYVMKHIKQMSKNHGQEGQTFAVVYFDVDDFRHINEMYGYQAGDQVLVDMSRLLSSLVKAPNLLSRLGEDRFVAILECQGDENASIDDVQSLIEKLSKSYRIGEEDYAVSVSAGIAFYPKDGKVFNDLMRSADTALIHAKSLGKDRVVAFQKDMAEARTDRIELIQNLHQAIKNNDFMLYFQPIYDLKTQKVANVEALIRWPHVSKGFIPPLDFIPVAEITGLIHKINDWVFTNAFKKHLSWKVHDLGAVKMSINLSAKSLINPVFIESLHEMCDVLGVDCKQITLEITETAMIEDLAYTEKVLKDLSRMGFEVALDDFGTGYSSLTYLKNLSIHTIKIDRQFITNCIETNNDKETLKYIIDLAHHLNMKVVAEGIENEHQLQLLKSLDCDYAQGYYLGRPMSADDLVKHIQKG
ncbi:MAG: putative bifunctional diguanylate cyclase/phosphodiesterase [Acholeplasmataceae bacterium]